MLQSRLSDDIHFFMLNVKKKKKIKIEASFFFTRKVQKYFFKWYIWAIELVIIFWDNFFRGVSSFQNKLTCNYYFRSKTHCAGIKMVWILKIIQNMRDGWVPTPGIDIGQILNIFEGIRYSWRLLIPATDTYGKKK